MTTALSSKSHPGPSPADLRSLGTFCLLQAILFFVIVLLVIPIRIVIAAWTDNNAPAPFTAQETLCQIALICLAACWLSLRGAIGSRATGPRATVRLARVARWGAPAVGSVCLIGLFPLFLLVVLITMRLLIAPGAGAISSLVLSDWGWQISLIGVTVLLLCSERWIARRSANPQGAARLARVVRWAAPAVGAACLSGLIVVSVFARGGTFLTPAVTVFTLTAAMWTYIAGAKLVR